MESELEIWQSRFLHYAAASREVWLRALQLITIGLTFLLTLTGIVIAQDALPILVAVPLVLVLLWAVGVRLLHESLHLSAHRDWANVVINRRLGRSETTLEAWHVYSGSSLSGHKQSASTGLPNRALKAILVSVSLSLAIVPGLYLAIVNPAWLWPVVGFTTVALIGLLLVAVAANRMNREAGELWDSIRAGVETTSQMPGH